MKHGKSGPGKYYYFLLPNNRSIRVGAQYSATLLKKKKKKKKKKSKIVLYDQEVNMICRLNEAVSGKLFIYENLRKKKFLGYLGILKLSRKKYII